MFARPLGALLAPPRKSARVRPRPLAHVLARASFPTQMGTNSSCFENAAEAEAREAQARKAAGAARVRRIAAHHGLRVGIVDEDTGAAVVEDEPPLTEDWHNWINEGEAEASRQWHWRWTWHNSLPLDVAQLGPAQAKAYFDTVRGARDARARAPLRRVRRGERAARARDADARRPPPAPPAEREPRGALQRGEATQDGGRPALHKHGSQR